MGGHCGQVWVIVESTQGLSLRGPCQKQLLPCSSGLLNVHTRPRNKCMTSAQRGGVSARIDRLVAHKQRVSCKTAGVV